MNNLLLGNIRAREKTKPSLRSSILVSIMAASPFVAFTLIVLLGHPTPFRMTVFLRGDLPPGGAYILVDPPKGEAVTDGTGDLVITNSGRPIASLSKEAQQLLVKRGARLDINSVNVTTLLRNQD